MASNQRELSIVVEAEDKASSKLANLGSTISKGFAVAGVAAAAAGTAVAAFAVKSVSEFADVGGAIQDMADRTGLATESISGLRVAAQLSGTSIETVEAAVKKMTLQNLDAATASDGLKAALLDVDDSIEELATASPDKQFEILANAIAETGDAGERARLATEAFGKAGIDLLPMLADGSFSLEDFNAQAEKLGVSFSPEKAAQAAAFGDAMDTVHMAAQGLSIAVGGELAPYLTKLMNDVIMPLLPHLQKLVSEGIDVAKNAIMFLYDQAKILLEKLQESGIIDAFKNALILLGTTLKDQVWPAIMDVWDAIQPVLPFVEKLAEVFGAVLVGAVLAFIGIASLLLGVFAGIVSAIAKFVGKILEECKPAIDLFTDGIQNMINIIKDLIDWFSKGAKGAQDFINKAKEVASIATSGVLKAIGGKALSGTRALGGPVTGGSTYLVGEHGPEIFTAPSGGNVVPNNRLAFGGMTGVSVNIQVGSVSSDMDVRRMAEQVGNVLLGKLNQNLGI